MGNWAEEAYAPALSAYKADVIQNTWGHLAPQKNTTYRGRMMVSKSGYGNADGKIIDMEWKALGDSPWLFDFVNDWIWENRETMKEDGIYLMECTFRNYRMWTKQIKIITLNNFQ